MRRGACSTGEERSLGGYRRTVLDFLTDAAVLAYVNGEELGRYSQVGVATPDHTIRTKNRPLVVPAPEDSRSDAFKAAASQAVAEFADRYHAYFERHRARHPAPQT